MNELQQPTTPTVFHFQDFAIREITDAHGEPWFVARDVCDILGLDNLGMALTKVPEHHLTSIRLMSGGQIREMKAVDEPGLYRLVLRSDKPQAEPFMEWITAEVLPSIRKTGSYAVSGSLATNSAMEAMASQIIGMVIPAVLSQVMTQVIPLVHGLQEQVSTVQINFSHCGAVRSFSHLCCQEGSTNTFVPKDDLYAAYCAYCQAKDLCPEGKTAFLTKLYRAFLNTNACHINQGGKKVPVVRGMKLLPGWEQIINDIRHHNQEKDATELARRRLLYCGVPAEEREETLS